MSEYYPIEEESQKPRPQPPSIVPILAAFFCFTCVAVTTFIWPFVFLDPPISQHRHIPISAKSRPPWVSHEIIKRHFAQAGNKTVNVAERTAEMTNFFNRMYTGPIKVGGQDLTVVFDTGSADLWVLSRQAWQEIGEPKGFHYYDSSKSSGAGAVCCSNWVIIYGSGRVTGNYQSDTVKLAKYELKGKYFAAASAVSVEFANPSEPTDGICGFAMRGDRSIIAQGCTGCGEVKTVAEKIGDHYPDEFNNGVPPISFYLSEDQDITSRLIVGEPDSTLYEGELKYAPVVPPHATFMGMWYLKMPKATVSGSQTNFASAYGLDGPAHVLVDTGTSFIGVPDAIFDALMSAITKSRSDCGLSRTGLWKCGDSWAGGDGLNSLTVFFETEDGSLVDFTLEGKDLVNPDASVGFMKSGGLGCDNCWILGDTFINKHYVVFDEGFQGQLDKHRIGIAPAKQFEGMKFIFVVIVLLSLISGLAGIYFLLRLFGVLYNSWNVRRSNRNALANRLNPSLN